MTNHVSTLISRAVNGNVTSHSEIPPESMQRAQTIIDEAFSVLTSLFPAWRHHLRNDEAISDYKKQLVKGMLEQRITNKAMVRAGIERARREPTDFMPSVGKLLSWCKPTLDAYGLPDSKTASMEYIRWRSNKNSSISHPAVLVAGRTISSWDVQHMDSMTYEQAFERAYDIVIRRVFNGEDIEADITRALSDEREIPKTPEEKAEARAKAESALSDIRSMMGM